MDIGFEITLAVITAVVVGLVQIAKQAGLQTRWCPLLAIALGIFGLWTMTFFAPIAQIIFTGIVIGLSATGLYSGVRATIKK